MKHFDTIISNLIQAHKDPSTQYSPEGMFPSANDLSFAISRLMDAQNILNSDAFDNRELPAELFTVWEKLRATMPQETASNLALCIIKNTPLSSSEEEIKQVEEMFFHTIETFTKNEEIAQIYTDVFFGEPEVTLPKMKDRD